MEGLNTLKIKKMNTNKVFTYIYKKKIVNKIMICNDINMCLSTVNQNLKILENENLIVRVGNFESTGGRKADQLSINKNFKFSIGIALLKNEINIVLTNLNLDVIYKQCISLIYENSNDYFKNLSILLDEFIESNEVNKEDILGVSFATQGIVVNGIVEYGVAMNNENMSLDILQKHFNYNLFLEHDSKCAASLSLWNEDIDNGFIFLLNNNLGSAVIINNEIISGYSGTIEHMKIDNNLLCYCGKKGCLETICSIESLEAKSGVTIGNFFQELRNKNNDFQIIWKNYLDAIAKTINNLNVVISGKFILTGTISSYLTESDLLYLYNKIKDISTFNFDIEKLVISEYKEYTQAVGASLHFIKNFIKRI